MATNRNHEPVVLEEFNGLFKRGDPDSCPIEYFSDCNNLKAIESGFETRDGIEGFLPLGQPIRMYNYKMVNGETLIVLDNKGDFYHALLDDDQTIYGPILHVEDAEGKPATDFDIYVSNGNCYISPFTTFEDRNGIRYQGGIEGEFVYVYKGDGTDARKAAGKSPFQSGNSGMVCWTSLSGAGVVEPGIHLIGITQIDNEGTGEESGALGPEQIGVVKVEKEDTYVINVTNIPQADEDIATRNIWMTPAIDPAEWDPRGDERHTYRFFRVGRLSDSAVNNFTINITDEHLQEEPEFTGGGALDTIHTESMYLENSENDGYADLGLHVVGVVYETDTGFMTAPGPEFFAVQTYVSETKSIIVHNIPVPPVGAHVIRKHLVSTKTIIDYNGNNKRDGFPYQLFFIPEATMPPDQTEININYYDADLIDDASHLIDNFDEIPCGTSINDFNGRMVLTAPAGSPNRAYVSAVGEPESIDQVDGIIDTPVDGHPLTTSQQFRGILYLFKKTRTYSVADNQDVPSTWGPPEVLDAGIGSPVHGIAQVLDSDGVNIDFLLVCDLSGVLIFNGVYSRPELTYAIQDYWLAIDKNYFDDIQCLNDTINQVIYISMPDKKILYADYSGGLDPKNITWWPWMFDVEVSTICLIRNDNLLIGSGQVAPTSYLAKFYDEPN